MEKYNLGRVVGSKIRNGNEMPNNFNGWLDGDIFIHNAGNTPYYEYVSGRLILRGELRGPRGFSNEYTLKMTSSDVEIYKSIYTEKVLEKGEIFTDTIMEQIIPQGVHCVTGFYTDSQNIKQNIYKILHDGHDIIINDDINTRKQEQDYYCEIL